MKNIMRIRLVLTYVVFMLCGNVLAASSLRVSSPNGKIKVNINDDKKDMSLYNVTKIVDRNTKLDIHLASGGGFAMTIKFRPSRKVVGVPQGKGIPAFYKKYVATDGLYVVSSDKVSDEALLKACDIMDLMLSKRPDIKKVMVEKGCHVMVIGKDENTMDLPEFKHLASTPDSIAYWNWRARGFGGAPEDTLSSSCGEENLLALAKDKYLGENILVHEFSHLIQSIGINSVEPGFEQRLETVWNNAKKKGLWNNTYAISNKEEYFAECVQSFFNCNRWSVPANGVHNGINRCAKLKEYDPEMYCLLCNYFDEIEIPVNNKIHE